MPDLYEHALRNGEGQLGAAGQFVVETGEHTGRSPKDKFFVREPGSETHIDWGETNKPIDAAKFDALFERVAAYLSEREIYALDAYVGADERYPLADSRHHAVRVAIALCAGSLHHPGRAAGGVLTAVYDRRRRRVRRRTGSRRNAQRHVRSREHGAQDRADRRHAVRG